MTIHSSILPGETPGQRSLAGYSSWGHKESDMTEWLTHTHTHTGKEINCCSALRDWTSKAQLKDKEGPEPTPPIPILSQTRGTHPAAKRLITSHSLIKLIHYNPPQGWTFNYATISRNTVHYLLSKSIILKRKLGRYVTHLEYTRSLSKWRGLKLVCTWINWHDILKTQSLNPISRIADSQI